MIFNYWRLNYICVSLKKKEWKYFYHSSFVKSKKRNGGTMRFPSWKSVRIRYYIKKFLCAGAKAVDDRSPSKGTRNIHSGLL